MYFQTMEAQQRRGRLYACIHCSDSKVTYVAERYRVADHIQKHHLALDQAAFYCNLCMFRCLTRDQLEKHLTNYKRHVMMANTPGIGDVRRYLVANPNPRKILEGVDYRLANIQDQLGQQFKHCDPFDEQPTTKDKELVTVRVTPEVLAALTSTGMPKHPLTASKVGQSTSIATQAPRYDPLRPGLHELDELSDLLSLPNPFQLPVNQQLSAPSPYVPTPQNSTLSAVRHTPLNTPVLRDNEDPLGTAQDHASRDENVLEQILGTNTPMTFSPQAVPSTTEVGDPTKPATHDQACQTMSPEEVLAQRYQPLTSTLGHLEKELHVSLGKIVSAVDSNTRATRHLGQSFESMAESLRTLSRTVERLVDDQRKQKREETNNHRAEKRPRTDNNNKENSPVLKSVVSKKNKN